VGGPIRSGEFGRELDVENGDLAGEELIAGLAAGLGLDSTSALLRSASLDFLPLPCRDVLHCLWRLSS
jgi:hypothetical protein